jgi:hypothetical protein
LKEHAGTSLFVRPICWTDLHARLLGARFVELPPSSTPVPARSRTPPRCHVSPSPAAATLSKELTILVSPTHQQPFFHVNSIRTVMATLYPDTLSRPAALPELNLYFGGRVYRDAVRVQLLWSRPREASLLSFDSATTRIADSFYSPESESPIIKFGSRSADVPVLAYVGRPQLAAIRRNLFRVVPGPRRSFNEPVARLQRLRARMLVPANSDHDAHFLGIFLAMAQRHYYGDETQCDPRKGSSPSDTSDMPQFRDTTVQILTHDVDSADFVVYTAVVPAACLELFHRPTRKPRGAERGESDTGIKVEFQRVPVWPILGLKERLGKALGRDVVGHFDEENIEMWEDEQDATPSKQGSLKRKERGARGALSEVLNESFEEDSEDDAVMQSKRRCLEGNTKLGVVM